MQLATRILLCLSIVFVGATSCNRDTTSPTQSQATSVIVRGNGGEPGSLEPALAEDIHAFNILADLYEGLVAQSADGTLIPGTAESWSVSDDALTYTFKLRDAAHWSNGEPVTSADFVRAFDRVRAPDSTSSYSFLLDAIDGLIAIDIGTLEIRLSQPAPQLLSVLSMPILYPVPPTADETLTFSDPASFVGNGAYLLIERSPGGPTRLRRNPAYWDAKSVHVDEIVYLPISEPTSELNMYRSGEIHITHTVPDSHIQMLLQDRPLELRIAPSLALYYLAFDLTEPPLDNGALRQALSMAIDREQLVTLVGRGEQPAYGIVPEGVADFAGVRLVWRDLSDEARASRARQLYREAGYSSDAPLAIKYTYDAGDIHEKVAMAIASMWRDVLGVEVTLEKKEWKYFLDTRDRRSEWQVMRFSWFGDYNHASTFTEIFRSGNPQNLPRYANTVYDRLLTEDSTSSDAEALLLSENPIAPLYFYVSKHLVSPHISGFEQNALDRHPSRFLSLTDVQ